MNQYEDLALSYMAKTRKSGEDFKTVVYVLMRQFHTGSICKVSEIPN